MSLVKLPSTFLLGAALAYIVWKSGSIGMAMVFHCLNNTISLLCAKVPEKIGEIVPVLVKDTLTVPELAVLAAIGGILAVSGLYLLRQRKNTE